MTCSNHICLQQNQSFSDIILPDFSFLGFKRNIWKRKNSLRLRKRNLLRNWLNLLEVSHCSWILNWIPDKLTFLRASSSSWTFFSFEAFFFFSSSSFFFGFAFLFSSFRRVTFRWCLENFLSLWFYYFHEYFLEILLCLSLFFGCELLLLHCWTWKGIQLVIFPA